MVTRVPYDGVVVAVPVTVPYRRYSTNTAHWWIGRAVHEMLKRSGLRPTCRSRLRSLAGGHVQRAVASPQDHGLGQFHETNEYEADG